MELMKVFFNYLFKCKNGNHVMVNEMLDWTAMGDKRSYKIGKNFYEGCFANFCSNRYCKYTEFRTRPPKSVIITQRMHPLYPKDQVLKYENGIPGMNA
jgi:hypothetical protein